MNSASAWPHFLGCGGTNGYRRSVCFVPSPWCTAHHLSRPSAPCVVLPSDITIFTPCNRSGRHAGIACKCSSCDKQQRRFGRHATRHKKLQHIAVRCRDATGATVATGENEPLSNGGTHRLTTSTSTRIRPPRHIRARRRPWPYQTRTQEVPRRRRWRAAARPPAAPFRPRRHRLAPRKGCCNELWGQREGIRHGTQPEAVAGRTVCGEPARTTPRGAAPSPNRRESARL